MNTEYKIIATLIVIALLSAVAWFLYPRFQAEAPEQMPPEEKQHATSSPAAIKNKNMAQAALAAGATQFRLVAEKDGQPLLELLQYLQPEVVALDYGQAIKRIGNHQLSKNQFWAVYQNGEFIAKGLETVTLKEGDVVDVILERTERYKGI